MEIVFIELPLKEAIALALDADADIVEIEGFEEEDDGEKSG